MKIYWVLVLLLYVKSVDVQLPEDGKTPEVTTELGKLSGKRVCYKGIPIDVYLGVPFAKPPVGRMRFLPPEPAEPWKGTLRATEFPPACPQYTPDPFPSYDNMTGHSEDCLYLNIWVPATPKKKPVMYWIYGGSFSMGSNRKSIYHDEALAGWGDVIVITTNYRIGPFGFLYSGSKDAPGNAGLYDMLEGLKWVNKHIGAFGGDNTSITIMGQSAGAISIGYFSVSPLTKGLYRRAILESGTALSFPGGNEKNMFATQRLAEHLNCANGSVTLYNSPQKVINCLRNVNANELARMFGELEAHIAASFEATFGDPITGGDPFARVNNLEFHDAAILIGNTKNDGSNFLTTTHAETFGFFGQKNSLVNKTHAASILRNGLFSSLSPTNREKAIDYYLGSVDNDDFAEIRDQASRAYTDFTMVCPSVLFAQKYSDKNDVFFFVFDHRPATTPWAPWMGTVHLEEVQFVFGRPMVSPGLYTHEEVGLAEEMMTYWSNFAKTGIPDADWPHYSRNKPYYRILDGGKDKGIGKGPHLKNCAFLKPFYDQIH